MKKPYFLVLLVGLCFQAWAAPVNQPAPSFDLPAADTPKKTVSLKEYAGKTVVLEWTNKDCPFVKKHYGSGNMQGLQKELMSKGVVWLSILSGKTSNKPEEAQKALLAQNAKPTHILLDSSGKVGQEYGAKTTPHMFVIDPKGVLVYQGAIDDQPTDSVGDIPKARNFVREAVTAVLTKKTVTTATTQPYGCSVKY